MNKTQRYQRRLFGFEQLEVRWVCAATPIFTEDFDGAVGSQPSSAVWTTFNAKDPNNNNVHYTNTVNTDEIVSDPLATDGKALALSMLSDPSKPGGAESGEIITVGAFQYGHFEASIRLPGDVNGQDDGIWPAFWLIGSNWQQSGWPASGEADVFEYNWSTPTTNQSNIHGPGYAGAGIPAMQPLPAGQNFASSYHVFAMDWAQNFIQFSMDGVPYETLTPASLTAGETWEFNHPFLIVLNVSEGFSGPTALSGPADANSQFPQTMLVDDVHVTQDAHTPSVTNAATFENMQSTSGLVITPNQMDVGVATNYQITDITGGTLYQNDGVTPITNREFITGAQAAAGLKFSPTSDSLTSGSFNVQASVTATVAGLDGAVVPASITVAKQPFHNYANQYDVNDDGTIAPIDVLNIINELNLPAYSDHTGRLPTTAPATGSFPYLDVNADGDVSAIDALLIINYLNGVSSAVSAANQPAATDSLAVVAAVAFASASGLPSPSPSGNVVANTVSQANISPASTNNPTYTPTNLPAVDAAIADFDALPTHGFEPATELNSILDDIAGDVYRHW